MKGLANQETDKSVNEFIESIPNRKRKADSLTLLDLMKTTTGLEPKIWGVSIIAFGKYKYARKNGEEHEWFNVGFSPSRSHITVYVMYDINREIDLLSKLGDHKTGKGCLYIKSLEKVDVSILQELISLSDRWK